LEISKVTSRLDRKGIHLVMTPEAQEFLLEKGFDQAMGARPLRRAVQRFLEDPLAEEILRGDLAGSDKVSVVTGDGGLTFSAVGCKKVKAS
jgi:ATP-dependent Clp protease ATP-binding subunit ClpC